MLSFSESFFAGGKINCPDKFVLVQASCRASAFVNPAADTAAEEVRTDHLVSRKRRTDKTER